MRTEGPAPNADAEDASLVQIVAADFAHSANCTDGLGPSGMIVDMRTSENFVSDAWVQNRMDPDLWAKAQPLMPRLRERNAVEQRADWRIPRGNDLIQMDIDAYQPWMHGDLARQARCAATFMLPAIAADGHRALVALRLHFDHGAIAFYTLHRDAGAWLIDGCSYYPFI